MQVTVHHRRVTGWRAEPFGLGEKPPDRMVGLVDFSPHEPGEPFSGHRCPNARVSAAHRVHWQLVSHFADPAGIVQRAQELTNLGRGRRPPRVG